MASSKTLLLSTLAACSVSAMTPAVDMAATGVMNGPQAVATALSGDIGFSLIDKKISLPDIPDDVDLMVRNCSTAGTLELLAGGYNTADGEVDMALEFFQTGFLEFRASGVKANVSFEMSLASGNQNTSFKVPITTMHLLTLPLGGLANINLDLEIALPVSAQMNAEADMFLGFLLSVPDGASIFLDVGNPSNSYATGFNQSTLTPLPFDVNTPNSDFSAMTGMEFTLTANASTTGATETFDTSAAGDVVLTMDLPMLKTTVKPVNNVNSACEPSDGSEQSYDQAVNVLWDAQLAMNVVGQYVADIDGTGESYSAPGMDLINHTFALPTQCLKWDPAVTGLVAPTAAPANTTLASSPSPTVPGTGSGSSSSAQNAASALAQPMNLMATIAVLAAVVAIL